MECPRCKENVQGNYCANCGRPAELSRINFQYLIYEIGSVLSFRKGLLFTIRELLIRPGLAIKTFISEDRFRLVKPIIFTIFCSFLYTIVQQQLHFEDNYYEKVFEELDSESASIAISNWVRDNYGYANILMGLFIVPWLKVLFRKYNYNFFELMVLWLFISGISMLFYLVFGVAETVTGWALFFPGGIVAMIYSCWAIGHFYSKNSFGSYVKALGAYILGFIFFSLFTTILGLAIDVLNGHL